MSHSGTIIHMRNIPECPACLALDAPLPCEMWPGYEGPQEIEKDFRWNGNSSSIMAPIFPQWNHPIASCRHDFRCEKATTPEQRKWSDQRFRDDVGSTSWWITKHLGYIGVRFGAMIGVGVRYNHPFKFLAKEESP
jgi:hypothetical protein